MESGTNFPIYLQLINYQKTVTSFTITIFWNRAVVVKEEYGRALNLMELHHSYRVSLAMGSHGVTFHPAQVDTPT